MSDEVYQAIAQASSGFVESPAGCGKTEAIVRTVGTYCSDPQLVLTHTHAGVDALRQRFREHRVPTARYRVDTIAGWSWGWVRKYPDNAGYQGSIDIAVWNDVYAAMSNLLQKDFVKQGVLNSYAGIIVDEYQDCTIPMHQLIVQLKRLLPCRVLGDDLQGIFGFGDDPLIGWSDVEGEFANDLGALETPHRWIKADNEPLGRWLLDTRPEFRQNREPDYRGSPIDRRTISYRDLGPQLIRMTHAKQGRICVIGPKARPLPAGIETALVNHNYRVLEPNELSALRKLILALSDGSPREKSAAAIAFLTRVHGGLSADDNRFIGKILKAENQRPRRADRRALCARYTAGTTPALVLELLEYIERLTGIACKLKESVSALKCVLEEHLESGTDLKALYADEITKRKYQSRSSVYRCVGSTLLVKGLEFDHTIILRSPNWQTSWGNHRDLYVALTRGSKSTTMMELTN
ncbi:MAG: AAA family ATPase [Gemmatimonadetes bacterium]|nr:AAA family ATPase [Gemmatimonadota bacterium]